MRKCFHAVSVLFFILPLVSLSAEKTIVSIQSSCMKKAFKAEIITPSEYNGGRDRFSTVYLLHGYSGDYTTWSRIVPLESYSDSYRCIIVCPDGNYNSWYINSPIKKNSEFETYIVKEVVPFVDSAFRTWPEANGRAIVGASMGGHGAATLLAKFPRMFCGAGSISGIMDLCEFPREWDISSVLGDYQDHRDLWKNSSFYVLCEDLKGKDKGLILDCGVSDFALPGNRKTHEKLISLSIPHDYYERPGAHSPLYVRDVAEYHFFYFSKRLRKPGRQ
jgi:S-formylglutathione hydrolase FrmB